MPQASHNPTSSFSNLHSSLFAPSTTPIRVFSSRKPHFNCNLPSNLTLKIYLSRLKLSIIQKTHLNRSPTLSYFQAREAPPSLSHTMPPRGHSSSRSPPARSRSRSPRRSRSRDDSRPRSISRSRSPSRGRTRSRSRSRSRSRDSRRHRSRSYTRSPSRTPSPSRSAKVS